jgi:hypothetical protein
MFAITGKREETSVNMLRVPGAAGQSMVSNCIYLFQFHSIKYLLVDSCVLENRNQFK